MATRQKITDILADRENIMTRPGKTAMLQTTKPGLVTKTARPALGDLGNKLINPAAARQVIKKDAVAAVAAAKKKVLTKQTTLPETKSALSAAVRPKPTVQPPKERHNTVADMVSYTSKNWAITDPDEGCKDNPQMVTEYLADIFGYMMDLEVKFDVEKDFLTGHKSTPKMRTILVNWLVDVHQNFKLCLETLHLCVATVDRYLQMNKNVGRESLQLVGTSAMLVASKYEEMYIPDLEDFSYICDDSFSRKQILKMEGDILLKLDFSLGRPTSVHFLRRYSKVAQVSSSHHTMSKYILELALMEYKLAHVKPSLLAAATCCLSIALLDEVRDLASIWNPTLVQYTGYKYADFRQLVYELAVLVYKSPECKFQATRNKYAAAKFLKISLHSSLSHGLIKELVKAHKM